MNSLFRTAAGIALVIASALSFAGCATGETDDSSAASQTEATQPAQASATPTPARTNAAGQEEPQGSMLTEAQIVSALKPLDFKCDPSELKALEVIGVEVQFSTVSCRRGQEPVVVFNLAANANELELITNESCRSADGTVLKNPIAVGGNWQALSASNDQPLLTVLAQTLGGTQKAIKDICVYVD